MVLSHERARGAGINDILRYELIDMVSTMALQWILMSRIKQSELIYDKCLTAIINHLHNIYKVQPKYRTIIRGLNLSFDTG